MKKLLIGLLLAGNVFSDDFITCGKVIRVKSKINGNIRPVIKLKLKRVEFFLVKKKEGLIEIQLIAQRKMPKILTLRYSRYERSLELYLRTNTLLRLLKSSKTRNSSSVCISQDNKISRGVNNKEALDDLIENYL